MARQPCPLRDITLEFDSNMIRNNTTHLEVPNAIRFTACFEFYLHHCDKRNLQGIFKFFRFFQLLNYMINRRKRVSVRFLRIFNGASDIF